MLELVFTLDDLARTRLAYSPLWEVVASVQVLQRARPPVVHDRWAGWTRRRLAEAKPDLRLLLGLISTSSWYTPDFLSPPPRSPVPDLAAELATLRGTPTERVRADLRVFAHARSTRVGSLEEASRMARRWQRRPSMPPTEGIDALYDDPAAGLDRLADQIEAYWELAIGPYWGRIRTLLDGDLLYRSRRLAEGGAASLFADLAPNVGWRGDALRIQHRRFSGTRRLDGDGVLLIASAFVWPNLVSAAIPPWQPSVTYPARGVGTLWEASGAQAPTAVSGVLGRTRAAVLALLEVPRSTSELAIRMDLTPGAVSQHLGLLRAAGLVTPHRVGHSVLYARTAVAESLLRDGSA
jgi:DNA-binding transcriptional ArsR family regulator